MPPRIQLRAIAASLNAPAPARVWANATRFASSSSSSKASPPPASTASPGPSSLFAPSPAKAGPSTITPAAGVTPTSPKQADIKNKKKQDPNVVPPLPRPLGVSAPPTSDPRTWSDRKRDLLDDERHKAKRKALVKEATQGYFHDYNQARAVGGGKLWVAPNVLIREDKALYFPDISGRSLLGSEAHTTDLMRGKTTLVSVISTRLAEEHEQSFVQPVLEDVQGHPGFNFLQINHQENKLKSILVSFLTSSLKRTIPQERWGSYLVSGGEWSRIDRSGPLGIDNKLLGYVYLVDSNLKIRWAGCGAALPEESQALRRATAVLLGRMKAGNAVEGGTESSS